MGRMAWGATTPRVCLGSVAIGKRLWRSRAVEKSQSRLSHRAWKSRPKRGIPTSPQPRRRRVINRQPDNSLATKTGPFNLLRTGRGSRAILCVRMTRRGVGRLLGWGRGVTLERRDDYQPREQVAEDLSRGFARDGSGGGRTD